jgi:hypothetical protein
MVVVTSINIAIFVDGCGQISDKKSHSRLQNATKIVRKVFCFMTYVYMRAKQITVQNKPKNFVNELSEQPTI